MRVVPLILFLFLPLAAQPGSPADLPFAISPRCGSILDSAEVRYYLGEGASARRIAFEIDSSGAVWKAVTASGSQEAPPSRVRMTPDEVERLRLRIDYAESYPVPKGGRPDTADAVASEDRAAIVVLVRSGEVTARGFVLFADGYGIVLRWRGVITLHAWDSIAAVGVLRDFGTNTWTLLRLGVGVGMAWGLLSSAQANEGALLTLLSAGIGVALGIVIDLIGSMGYDAAYWCRTVHERANAAGALQQLAAYPRGTRAWKNALAQFDRSR